MPFTLEGNWIPTESKEPKKPVKIRVERRGNKYVTLVTSLPVVDKEKSSLLSALKKKLGCGGTVKEDQIEIQGDQKNAVIQFFTEMGFKISEKTGS